MCIAGSKWAAHWRRGGLSPALISSLNLLSTNMAAIAALPLLLTLTPRTVAILSEYLSMSERTASTVDTSASTSTHTSPDPTRPLRVCFWILSPARSLHSSASVSLGRGGLQPRMGHDAAKAWARKRMRVGRSPARLGRCRQEHPPHHTARLGPLALLAPCHRHRRHQARRPALLRRRVPPCLHGCVTPNAASCPQTCRCRS